LRKKAHYEAPYLGARHILELANYEEPIANGPKEDKINHPGHYNQGKFEVIAVLEDWKLGYHLGNVVKYIARSKHKDTELEDLQKARWYLDRYISLLEKEIK